MTEYPDMRGLGECHPCANEGEAIILAMRIGGTVCVLRHTAPKEYVDWFVAEKKESHNEE
jgi:hypothetical protein